ncbi:MAG: sugar ABC transporter permease [Ignavibacteria bacterium]|jgi:putative chitobiose transport system permease protein|nr:sugar ABC transporter permease [Ignavibacteria bacterium]MDH7527934.1 sugar ABC transporter permease [Ignavibacteria bacterium]
MKLASKSSLVLFLLPTFVFIFLFSSLPTLLAFSISLFKINFFGKSEFVGLKNFLRLFYDKYFYSALINSFIYLLVTPVLALISLTLAVLIKDLQRGQNFFKTIYFLPVVTPVIISGIMWRYIFNEDSGFVNYVISLFFNTKVNWLTSYPENIFSVMILTIWRGFGYYLIIFFAGLMSISKDIEEAAILDGAGFFRRMFFIVLPQLKPTLTLVFVLSGSAAIKLFTEIYILIPGAPLSHKTMVYYLYHQAFERFDLSYGSTIGIVVFVITLGFSYLNLKLIERER